MNLKEIEKIAKENGWNSDHHTLFVLSDLEKEVEFPGERYAIRRAIKIIKKRKP